MCVSGEQDTTMMLELMTHGAPMSDSGPPDYVKCLPFTIDQIARWYDMSDDHADNLGLSTGTNDMLAFL